jgi:hypothetical protein
MFQSVLISKNRGPKQQIASKMTVPKKRKLPRTFNRVKTRYELEFIQLKFKKK